MTEADKPAATDRRSLIVGRLVEQYQSAADPDRWLQGVTLQALRALNRANLTPMEKGSARREIHTIHREAAAQARALKRSRSLMVIIDR